MSNNALSTLSDGQFFKFQTNNNCNLHSLNIAFIVYVCGCVDVGGRPVCCGCCYLLLLTSKNRQGEKFLLITSLTTTATATTSHRFRAHCLVCSTASRVAAAAYSITPSEFLSFFRSCATQSTDDWPRNCNILCTRSSVLISEPGFSSVVGKEMEMEKEEFAAVEFVAFLLPLPLPLPPTPQLQV